jgi:hypothetical protein
MKLYRFALLISFLLLGKISYCDIIPENSHAVDLCAVITNLSDYPEISLLGYVTGPTGVIPTYQINATDCLQKGYKYNTLYIYAVKNCYLSGKDITTIDWTKDCNALKSSIDIEPFGGYVDDSNPINAKEQFYKIVGFTDTSVVIFKWKEINKFNNGKADSVKLYSYSGDVTVLSQEISTSIKTNTITSSIELFPNPAKKNFHLKITNNYSGKVSIKVHSIDGKSVRSLVVDKSETTMDYAIDVDKVAKDYYLVDVIMGKTVEVRKLLIE